MSFYEILLGEATIDLLPFSRSLRPGLPLDSRERLESVPSTRRGRERIENPYGLQADALRAAERLALEAYLDSGVPCDARVVRVTSGGAERKIVDSAHAGPDPRREGVAYVESRRGYRLVECLEREPGTLASLLAGALR